MALHVAAGLFKAAFLYPRLDAAGQADMERRWCGRLLGILAVRMRVTGSVPGGGMVVGNHVSWLDPFLVLAHCHVRFVGKSEVRGWPVIGWLAWRAGTLFIHRSRRHDTARVNGDIAAALAGGTRVGVFPEGTTTDGTWMLHFHSSLLEPAVRAGVPVHPMTIRYVTAEGSIDTVPAYEGETTLLQSMMRCLSKPEILVEISFLPPIESQGRDRRSLTREAEQAVARSLGLAILRKAPETPGGPPAGSR